MEIRVSHRKPATATSLEPRRQDNPSRRDLELGLDKVLLDHTRPRQYGITGSIRTAADMLPNFDSEDYKGIKGELEQADNRAEKTWLFSFLAPLGLATTFAGMALSLPVLPVLGVSAGLGVAGFGALAKSLRDEERVRKAKLGMEAAAEWAYRDDAPEPISRNAIATELRRDINDTLARGDLSSSRQLLKMEETLRETKGQDSLELLKNMSEKDQSEIALWMRSTKEREGPSIPIDTPLSTVAERVEKVLENQLAEEDYLGAKLSLGTLSLMEDSESENWAGFVQELLDDHEWNFKIRDRSYYLPYGSEKVNEVRTHVKDAISAFQAEPNRSGGQIKTRAEAEKMLEDANEVPIFYDYPNDGKARRAFRKLPGADVQEMVSQPGAKNRKRAQMVLQALHDCQLEWVIGTD